MKAYKTLYESPCGAVVDFACRPPCPEAGPEEAPSVDSIVFVRRGAFTRLVERETLVAEPTQILFFPKGRPYRISHPIAGGHECTVLRMPEAVLATVDECRRFDDRRPPADARRLQRRNGPHSILLHYELLARARRDPRFRLGLDELLLELVHEALADDSAPARARSTAEDAKVSHAQRELATAAQRILTESYQAPPGLDVVARTLGCSPFHLCRSFTRAMGLPMRRYVDRLRLRVALCRLADGATDLTTLALDLGYADHSHFTNAFRREFGLAPSAFRARQR